MHTWLFSYSIDELCILTMDFIALSVMVSVFLVLSLLYFYIPWYMASEPRKFQFFFLIILFSSSILFLSLVKFGLLFLFFWETLRVSSYLLVSWWKGRDLANSFALVRLLSSRIRDVCLFLVISGCDFFERFLFSLLFLMAFSSKSAQFLFFPWLLRAIERPRPVSALLHSSTLVLAGVILSYRLKEIRARIDFGLLFSRILRLLLRVIGTIAFTDLKKRVACSTVYNVRFIFVWVYLSEYEILSMHMLFHAIIKSSTFVLLRVSSHLLNIQDIRHFLRYGHKHVTLLFILLLRLLSILPLVGVLSFKETRVEMLIDRSLNIQTFLRLFLISSVGFLFFIEYLSLLPKHVFSNTKFVPLPSFTHVYLFITLPLAIVLSSHQTSNSLGNTRMVSSYVFLLVLRLLIGVLLLGRTFVLDFQYVSKYNSTYIRNLNSIKQQFSNLELFLNLRVVKKTEWFVSKNWRHNSKLSSVLLFSSIFVMLLLILSQY